MVCKSCELAQAKREKEFYVRVGQANILVYGCDYHLNIMFEQLKAGRNILKGFE